MSIQSIISATLSYLLGLPKKKLVELIDSLRQSNQSLSRRNAELETENKRLRSLQVEDKVKAVNKKSNKPSSKQAEWEQKGVGNDGIKKKKGRGKKGRKGAGNKVKNKMITREEVAKVEQCAKCGEELRDSLPLWGSNSRIIEDILRIPAELEVIEVKQEKKYCKNCQSVTTGSSLLALPGSTLGLNITVSLLYLWLKMGLPYTRIADYFKDLYGLKVSTSGLSLSVIRVSKIMTLVYEEILEDIRNSSILHADETGWRVQGKNWWLWVFGNKESALYTIDKSRGKDVVHRILGEYFIGVLVVDGWGAYLHLLCEQQSCMAHLLRKIRNLYAAFPNLRSIFKFYVRFRKILRDGERLQVKREELGEKIFQRRLEKLHNRLDQLVKWPNPNDILKDIIKKVKKQRPRILTFVEHPDVPCHNNHGEYLMRIGVLKRKISYGSKSEEGATAYALLLSIYTTCKLRNIPFFDFMKGSLECYIRTQKPLLLKEYSEREANKILIARPA